MLNHSGLHRTQIRQSTRWVERVRYLGEHDLCPDVKIIHEKGDTQGDQQDPVSLSTSKDNLTWAPTVWQVSCVTGAPWEAGGPTWQLVGLWHFFQQWSAPGRPPFWELSTIYIWPFPHMTMTSVWVLPQSRSHSPCVVSPRGQQRASYPKEQIAPARDPFRVTESANRLGSWDLWGAWPQSLWSKSWNRANQWDPRLFREMVCFSLSRLVIEAYPQLWRVAFRSSTTVPWGHGDATLERRRHFSFSYKALFKMFFGEKKHSIIRTFWVPQKTQQHRLCLQVWSEFVISRCSNKISW